MWSAALDLGQQYNRCAPSFRMLMCAQHGTHFDHVSHPAHVHMYADFLCLRFVHLFRVQYLIALRERSRAAAYSRAAVATIQKRRRRRRRRRQRVRVHCHKYRADCTHGASTSIHSSESRRRRRQHCIELLRTPEPVDVPSNSTARLCVCLRTLGIRVGVMM